MSNYTRNRRADEWRRKRNAPFEAEREERVKRSHYVTVEEEQPEIKRLISMKEGVDVVARQYQCSTRGFWLTTVKTWLALHGKYGRQLEQRCPCIVACRTALLQFQLQYRNSWSNSEIETSSPLFQRQTWNATRCQRCRSWIKKQIRSNECRNLKLWQGHN